jgi:hypothetical protein
MSTELEARGFRVQVETVGRQSSWSAIALSSPSAQDRHARWTECLPEMVARADEIKHPCATEHHLGKLQTPPGAALAQGEGVRVAAAAISE